MKGTIQYRTMRDFLQSMDDHLPGRFEIAKEGIVHGMAAGISPHELTTLRLRKRVEKAMPDELVAHTGAPDVEVEGEGIMRRPDVMVSAWADMDVPGSFDPCTGTGAVLTDIYAAPATPPARNSSTARTSPSPSGPSRRRACRGMRGLAAQSLERGGKEDPHEPIPSGPVTRETQRCSCISPRQRRKPPG